MSDDTLKEATESGIEMAKLLAAASHASAAAFDMIEVVRDGGVLAQDNVGSGDTATILADGLRLLIEVTGDMDDADGSVSQLHGALIRFLEDRA